MSSCIVRFARDESGLTVVEYVVGAGAIVLALSGFFSAFSDILLAEINRIFAG